MEEKVFRGVLIALASLLLAFATLKTYKYYSQQTTEERISGEVMLYTKQGCKYCSMARNLLERTGIIYNFEDISNNPTIQQKLLNETGQRTVPYIFMQGKFIGGYSDLAEMKNDGRLLDIAVEIKNNGS